MGFSRYRTENPSFDVLQHRRQGQGERFIVEAGKDLLYLHRLQIVEMHVKGLVGASLFQV